MFEFDHVSLGYPSSRHNQAEQAPIIDNLTLALAPREFVCVLGPSGCGKTTLLNLAAGFLKPDQGRVRFDGREISGPSPQRGVVFQDATLFPWRTVLGNVMFGLRRQGVARRQARHRAIGILTQVGLGEQSDAWPVTLSGGMRQRAALARTLALNPQALLMDEPFSALDANSREHLQDTLLDLWQEQPRTVLYITHSVEEAAYLADRVLIFGPAPNHVCADLSVPLPRPRYRSSPEVQQLARALRRHLNQLPCCLKPSHVKELP
nr:ABC transporter ATP-binding protein [uncultured Desulfuromonas sp.]